MQCIWCEKKTTTSKKLANDELSFANLEHIFPKAVGGIKTLSPGAICEDCNNELGSHVDLHLKTQNIAFMMQYQTSSYILGKPIGRKRKDKKNKDRKEDEIKKLTGYGGGAAIERGENFGDITLKNMPDGSAGDITYNAKFSKALHKCAINVMLDLYGYDHVKNNYSDLIDFIKDYKDESSRAWSYGICYSNPYSLFSFEPFLLSEAKHCELTLAISIAFPCGIFVVGLQPHIVTPELLKVFGNQSLQVQDWIDAGFDYHKHYKSIFSQEKLTFGELFSFFIVKKEIEGRRNPDDFFYLLVKCKVCNQINPTGIMIPKSVVLGKTNGIGSKLKNSWNYHRKSDLDILCPGVEFSECIKKAFINDYGINHPEENSPASLNIKNSNCICINCNESINYDSKDCFY